MDSWLVELIAAVAPSTSQTILKVYDKIKGLKSDEAYVAMNLILLAQLIEQNNVMNRKLDSANEALAILLKRTEK
ncbi:MAG: hypothetical protein QXK90_01160 [Candidatus Parvarchaeota archaeon]|nr:hypothetical protein [Candidatus Jordarchaeia archaeon]